MAIASATANALMRVVEVHPEPVGARELRGGHQRLPRRAHRHVADDEVHELPEDQKADDEDQGVAQRTVFVAHQCCPLLASSSFSQCVRTPLRTIDSSRISRISGYIVALSKLV